VVMVASSVSVAFAVDKSEIEFKKVSDISFLNDILSRFNQGNGIYSIPLDYDTITSSIHKDILAGFNSGSYSYVFNFFYSSGNVYLKISMFPKGNYKFVNFRADDKSGYCVHYCLNYQTYVSRWCKYAQFQYDSDRKIFVYHPNSGISGLSGDLPYIHIYYPCRDMSFYCYYLSPDISFSGVASADASKLSNSNLISDISSISFVDCKEYVPPAPATRTFTINYLYSENNPAADSVTQEIVPGEEYSIPSPEIEGYAASIPLVTGTMPDEDLTIDVYYSRSFYPLTVKYQYSDGRKAAEDVIFQYPSCFAYSIPSPEITGCQADKPTVSGTMPGKALEEVVTYSPASYTLGIYYRYEDGTQAAGSHQEQLVAGSSYSVPSPAVSGYKPDTETISGVMPAKDTYFTVVYHSDSGGGSSGSGGSEGGGETPGGGGTGGGSVPDDPFDIPSQPPFSGYDPFVINGLPPWSGYDPFVINGLPSYTYDPFVMPEK